MGVTKSHISNVQASANGGLAVYVDSITGEAMLKDFRGSVEPLSNYIKNNSDESENASFYLFQENNSLKPTQGNNILEAKNSVILSGDYNVVRGNFAVIVGGESNTTGNKHSFIGGGQGGTIDADYGIILGGKGNIVNGRFSSVLAGENNNINKHTNSHIIGSGILADRDDTTFVNNLSIKNIPTSVKGLPKGSIWSNKGILSIVE